MQSNLLTPPQTEKGTLKRASVRTMGCRLNQSEGIALEGKLRQAGYELVPFGEPAELGVINTCTVTNEADSKSRNAIRRFCQKNPSATTVVVGCYSQISANEVAMVEGVDYVIGNHDKLNFLDYLSEDKPETPVVVRERIDREDFSIGVVGEAQFEQRANLKIQDGCDFMCTFCIIPFARGRARSRDWQDLLMDARQMIEKGVRELVLTGVNLGTYQSGVRDFLGMINGLSELKGLDRLRISSIEPTTIPEELFPLMADRSHPLMPYLHVPMQAGSDQTLERMKRRYNLAEMDAFFNRATSAVPDLCVGTDLMVGFPGESHSDFEETCDTFIKGPFAYCHVFTYSEREGTPAAKSGEQVPMYERRRRSAHLRRLSASKRMDFHISNEGKEMRVLLENPKDNSYFAYSDNYLKVRVPEEPHGLANRMAKVKIGQAFPEYCIADLVDWEGDEKTE
jgi:threonylcarbamoyladenosine tRNA methylthiotransferase MtaB